jgi:c-di-GMP-binding flagellar brake protein YcgR
MASRVGEKSAERRKYRRTSRTDVVKISEVNLFDDLDLSDTHERKADGRLLNISAGGVLLETDQPYDPKCVVKVEVFIPDWVKYDYTRMAPDYRVPCDPLVAVGRVVRKEPSTRSSWRLGVSFVAIDEKHRRAVDRFVSAALSDR